MAKLLNLLRRDNAQSWEVQNIKLFDRENNLLYNYKESPDISPKIILEKEFSYKWKKEEIKKFEEKWQLLIKMMENRKASFEEISELKNEKEELIKYLAKKYDLCQNFKYENSCGAIVFNNKIKKFLIVKMFNGNWGFPKGHIEEYETQVETAKREVFEETGIEINIVSDKKYEIKYIPNETTIKKVTFFIGITENEEVTVDEQEIEAYKWCSYEEALKTITYRLQKEVLENSYKILKQKNLESLEN